METTQKPRVTPKDFFLWLGAMAALYVATVSLITLLFQYINILFPSALEYSDAYSGAIRFSIAALVVVFPLFIFLMRVLHQALRKHPEKKELWVRKWLIFLTLFIAGVTIAIDLIVLVNTFLNGDLSSRFLWKALTILVVIGAGFLYYAYELKGRWEQNAKQSVTIAGLVSAVVIVAIVSGFFLIGSPTAQRLERLDAEKVNDLSSIQSQIVSFWQAKERLPESLEDLKDPLVGTYVPVDPETNEPYVYRVTGPLSFELCATFNQENNADVAVKPARDPYYGYPYEEDWQHSVGEECFERTIDPERFPALKK